VHLTRHTDHALRALIYLTLARERWASAGEIAEAFGVSAHHLAKIAQRLARLGWVEQRRGRSGGIRLAVEPPDLGVGQVVRALENLHLAECFDRERDQCVISRRCTLQRALREATDAWLAVLDRYTLADLAGDPRALAPLVGLSPPSPPRSHRRSGR
jgi:Rrf2 family transcriptional regulator, nitric oxide-sensitive transcriptional repressor